MSDTTPKFDPIPRLQQISATIEESGADIFDAPATAVHYIKCAIKEIERLRKERDDARRASAAWEANLAEPQEIDPADLQALIDATWKDDRLTVRMSARDLWRMATDRRGREEE